MSLQQKAISSFIWTALEQVGTRAINFGVQIVLARLIAPEEFGLLGMILVFNAISNSLSDSGMTQSLIRMNNPKESDFSSVFSINLSVSLFLYGVIWFIAPYVAEFYNQPRLTNILRVYSLAIVINSFFGIQQTRLTHALNFKFQLRAKLPALIVSGAVGIGLALYGHGIWALVFSELALGLTLTSIYFLQTKWIPKPGFDWAKIKNHFNFGYKLTVSGVLSRLVYNIVPMIVGKFYSAALVGYYTRAFTMKDFPIATISGTLDKVVYPVFSKIKHDPEKLSAAHRRMQMLVILILGSLMLFLMLSAYPLFGFLLGDKWLPAVPYFQLLCIIGILYPINNYNTQIYKIMGRTDITLKIGFIFNGMLLTSILLAARFGIMAMILAQILTWTISTIISIRFTNKLVNYPLWLQIKDAAKTLAPAFLAISILFFLKANTVVFSHWSYLVQFMVMAILFVIITGAIHFLVRTKAMIDLVVMLKDYMAKRTINAAGQSRFIKN